MNNINDLTIPPAEGGFLPSEKSKWFSQEEYYKTINQNLDINNFNIISKIRENFYPSDQYKSYNEKTIMLSMKAIIELNSKSFKNKNVLVLNSTLGLFSLFSAKNGARHVYSITSKDCYYKYQNKIIESNNYSNIITVINKDIYNVTSSDIPEEIDIIICNWMGNFIVHNSSLLELIHARDYFLRKGGIIFPDQAKMFIAGIDNSNYKKSKIHFWDDIYGINMRSLKNESLCSPIIDMVDTDKIITDKCLIYKVDAYKVTEDDLEFSNEYLINVQKDGVLNGLCCWFDIKFNKIPNKIKFSTTPFNLDGTKWAQITFYLKDDNIKLKKGDVIYGSICSRINEDLKDLEGLDIKLSYYIYEKEYLNSENKEKDKNKIIKGIQLYKLNDNDI